MKRDEANEDAQRESERKESKERSRVADAVVRCDQIASAADTRQNGESVRVVTDGGTGFVSEKTSVLLSTVLLYTATGPGFYTRVQDERMNPKIAQIKII